MVATLLAVGLVAPFTAFAPQGEGEDAIRAALQSGFEAQGLIGMAAAVVEDGEIRELYFGLADRAAGRSVDGETSFRWASISKPVTAIAAMQLVEQGKLDLDRDVREYVPEFPEKPWTITARQLLCHRGGVVHYRNGEVIRTEREYEVEHPFADVVTALDTFKESPLVAEPGTKYSYTTHGYILLGAVVQKAGDAPFHEQVAARIAGPLGMTSFQPDYQWKPIAGRTRGYGKRGDFMFRSPERDVSWKLPGGGYTSTVGDLARFARGLMTKDALLPDEVLRTMWTRQPAPETESGTQSYGLGFGVRDADGVLRVSHTGSQEKTRTLMQLEPDRGVALVLMTNSEWANLGVIAKEAWSAMPRATPPPSDEDK